MNLRKVIVVLAGAVAALFALDRIFGRREVIDWEDADKPGRIVDVDGLGVHVVEAGRGPAVILIHGFGGHTFSFRYLIPALAREHRVIALDLKGFGYTERVDTDYSQTAQARLVVGLMDALGVEKASLVGHSMGGGVAMRVASTWPQRVESVVLAGSVSGDRLPVFVIPFVTRALLPIFARLLGRRLFRRSYYDRALATDAVREEYQKPARIRGSLDGLLQMMRHSRRDRLIDFERIAQPVLILWAAGERVLPGLILRRLRRRLPHAEVVMIERAGHLLLEERPEECHATIRRFLGRAGPSPEVVRPAVDSLAASS